MFFKIINDWLEGKKAITYLLLFLISLTFFFWLQDSSSFADPDSFYHAKIAQMTAESGVVKEFPYLQATVLTDNFVDHHLLYHLVLVPFVKWLPSLVAVKIAHVFLDSFLILAFFWLLTRLKVRHAFWYTLFLFICGAFIFRISLVKAQPISLMIIMAGVYLILAKKPMWLFGLAWLYVYAYGGWFLLLFLAGLYAISDGLNTAINHLGNGRFSIKKVTHFLKRFFRGACRGVNLKILFSISLGHICGLIFNPYFPQNLKFYWYQLVQIGMVNYQDKIGVGAEWYPFSVTDFFQNLGLPILIMSPAVVFLLAYFKKFSLAVKYLFLMAVFFLVVTVKSKRYVEYAIPFMIIFSAVVYSGVGQIKKARLDLAICRKEIGHYLFGNQWLRIFMVTVFVISIVFVGYNNMAKNKKHLAGGASFSYLEGASNYLMSVSDPGDIIFHSDWDDFPALFFHNNKDYYLVGLDPTFMYLKDARKYNLWKDVTLGRRRDEVYQIVKNDFSAKYVLITTDHKEMNESFENNFYFKKVYSDKEATIYKMVISNL